MDTEKEYVTTEQTLEMMRKKIRYCRKDTASDHTKETLRKEYEACLEVCGNLSKQDMLLIWYLHHGSNGLTWHFLQAAKFLYERKTLFEILRTQRPDLLPQLPDKEMKEEKP